MRKLFFSIAFMLVVGLLVHSCWSLITERVPAANLLSLKHARLYMSEPDQKLIMPLRSVRVRHVKDSWHAPRDGERMHQGQDIFAPRGTPIHSATEGYVVRIGENRLGGQTISVLGAGGRVYYYAHLDSYAPSLDVGDYVTPETVLGAVGTTGNAKNTSPHLHFGVYAATGAINPLPLLADRS
ncbi:MAG TPA: M23 family metallopeptidase [Pyrinomonadaceae bacterium]|nr:M23 family metallopeptidase [Pyrinomonadaceae bacterium]